MPYPVYSNHSADTVWPVMHQANFGVEVGTPILGEQVSSMVRLNRVLVSIGCQ